MQIGRATGRERECVIEQISEVAVALKKKHYKTLPKHKSKRALKKYANAKLRKDKTFTGIKVYSYTIGNYWYFTSKPKQDGTNAYSYKYALFLTRCNSKRFIAV